MSKHMELAGLAVLMVFLGQPSPVILDLPPGCRGGEGVDELSARPAVPHPDLEFPNWEGNIGFSPWLLKIVTWIDGGLL